MLPLPKDAYKHRTGYKVSETPPLVKIRLFRHRRQWHVIKKIGRKYNPPFSADKMGKAIEQYEKLTGICTS